MSGSDGAWRSFSVAVNKLFLPRIFYTCTKDVLKNTAKAMFIFGTDDKFITEEIREKLIGEFPNVKAVIIPETGHNSFIENPEATLKAIEGFIG